MAEGDRLSSYEPTRRERHVQGIQEWLVRLGADQYKARRHAQALIGGGGVLNEALVRAIEREMGRRNKYSG